MFNFKTKKQIYFFDPTKANSVFTVFFNFFFYYKHVKPNTGKTKSI